MFDIIADSACDFTPEMAQKIGVEIVPFYVSLDGEHYRKEGKEIAVRDFYQFMVDNPSAYPKTSLASIEDFEEVFRRQAEAGRPTLCLCFTGKMSGCVGSARNARELVLEDYPDAKIEVMDSEAATVTEATMVENAVAIRDAGCTLDEAVTWLEAEKSTNNIFFTVGNLDYLIKGGRIGKVSGRAANFLGIKPMILFKDGEIFSGGVARGRQKSFEKALEQLMNYLDANGGTVKPDSISVQYGMAVGQLPVPVREGYTFDGWYDENGAQYTEDTVYAIAGDATLTARWTANIYEITLDANGGVTDVALVQVTFGQAVGALPVPTREGYTFGGWYDKDGNRYDASSVYSVKGDTTLTARWIENSVQTGDGFPIFLLSGAMMAAAAGAVMLLLKRRKLMGE